MRLWIFLGAKLHIVQKCGLNYMNFGHRVLSFLFIFLTITNCFFFFLFFSSSSILQILTNFLTSTSPLQNLTTPISFLYSAFHLKFKICLSFSLKNSLKKPWLQRTLTLFLAIYSTLPIRLGLLDSMMLCHCSAG